jgi:hypothetical protein
MDTLIETKRQTLKLFSQNLKIIDSLYPNKSYSLSQLSPITDWDVGTLSKACSKMIKYKLLLIKEERKGKGKPQKIVGLTELSYRLYGLMNEFLEKQLVEKEKSDPAIIDEYFKMLSIKDTEIRKVASDGLYYESTRKAMPDEKYFINLQDVLFDPEYTEIKKVLLQTLLNLAKNADEKQLNIMENKFNQGLKTIFNNVKENDDKNENLRILSLNILAEILPPSERYDTLMAGYLKLLKENSLQTSAAKSLILSKYSEKTTDLKITLLRLYGQSDPSLRERISIELSSLG